MPVRPATAADLRWIAAIYDDQVATSIATFDLEPRPLGLWEERLASTEPGDHFVVATEGDQVIGFAYSSAYRTRPAYAHTREVTVYLGAESRGRGLGRALYDVLLPAMRADGVHLAIAVVALPNPASEALHRAWGFVQVGALPEVGRKFGRWVDTALYARVLSPGP